MALYVGRAEDGGSAARFDRITFAWDAGELVLEHTHAHRVRLLVTIGDEHEEHELDLGGEGMRGIATESKLIKIEDIGKPGAIATEAKKRPPTPVNAQSKLIKIEDVRASLPDATIVLP